MGGRKVAQLTDDLRVTPELKLSVDAGLEARQAPLLEVGDRGAGKRRVGKIRERGAPPKRKRRAPPIDRRSELAGRGRRAAIGEQPLEAREVQPPRLDA